MKNKIKGQGLIELVISVGVLMLVLGGTVSLLVFSMGKRNKSFDRDKASRLAEVVIERLVENKKNEPEDFWNLTEVSEEEMDEFVNYVYSVGYTDLSVDCGCLNCCAKAVVTINWNETGEEIQFSRFFAK